MADKYVLKNPNKTHRRSGGEIIEPGQPFTPTEAERRAFGDLMTPAGSTSRSFAGVDIPREDDDDEEGDTASDTPFDVTGSTVDEVLAAVRDGVIEAEAALDIEESGKGRSSLVSQLITIIDQGQV